MQSERRGAARRLRLHAVAVCALALAWPATARAALCGDTGGDGFFTASDALITLRLAVTTAYDRRGDVMPRPSVAESQAGDGSITAVDALESLRAAVEARIPPCYGADSNRAVVSTAAFDFSSGGFAVVDVATRTFHYRPGAIRRDSVVRVPSGILSWSTETAATRSSSSTSTTTSCRRSTGAASPTGSTRIPRTCCCCRAKRAT